MRFSPLFFFLYHSSAKKNLKGKEVRGFNLMKLLLFNQGTRGHDGVHESVVLQENYIQGVKISFCFPVIMR